MRNPGLSARGNEPQLGSLLRDLYTVRNKPRPVLPSLRQPTHVRNNKNLLNGRTSKGYSVSIPVFLDTWRRLRFALLSSPPHTAAPGIYVVAVHVRGHMADAFPRHYDMVHTRALFDGVHT